MIRSQVIIENPELFLKSIVQTFFFKFCYFCKGTETKVSRFLIGLHSLYEVRKCCTLRSSGWKL